MVRTPESRGRALAILSARAFPSSFPSLPASARRCLLCLLCRSLAAVTPVSIRPPWQAVLCFVVRRLLMLGRVEERQEIS